MGRRGVGRFAVVRDGDADWAQLYDGGIARLPGDPVAPGDAPAWREHYPWLLAPALALLMAVSLPRRAVACVALLLLGVALAPPPVLADEVAAWQAWQQKQYAVAQVRYARIGGYAGHMGAAARRQADYAAAARHFGAALLQASDERARTDALYNLGNAHYGNGNPQAAAEAFETVLRLRPGDPRARQHGAGAAAIWPMASSILIGNRRRCRIRNPTRNACSTIAEHDPPPDRMVAAQPPAGAAGHPAARGVGRVFQYALVDRHHRYDADQLRAVQDFFLKYELQSLPGVAEVASVGGMARQFQIEVNPYRLAAYRLSLEEVSQAVRDSNVSGDKSVAEMLRVQQEAINAMNGEMAADAERAAKAVADSYKRASDLKMQADVVWLNSATAARLAVVDADEAAAHHAVEMGVMTHEELLQQQIGFEQRRNEIILQAMNERLAMIDPSEDPVAYAQLKAEIEAAERQHQAVMTEVKNAGELERSQYALGAINSIQSGVANSLQQMMMGQMTLAQGLKAIWSSVLSAITGEVAKFAAQWIAKKLAMLVFGKATALSEIATDVAKAAAGVVASMAAALWPLNMTAPAFGAAMAAAAAAFAPAASAAGGYDIPAGVNPITQLHAREMVLPARQADVIRRMADEGGDDARPIEVHVHQNISAWDSVDARRALMDNQDALVAAIKNAHRNGYR